MREDTLEVEDAGIAAEGMQAGPDGGGETLTVEDGEYVAQTEVIEGEAAEGDIVGGVPETGQQAVGDLDRVTDTPPAPVAAIPPPQLEQADSSESGGLLDKLMSNAAYLGFGAAALVLLMGLVWFLLRRRRAEEAQFQESILTAEDGVSDTETQELFDTVSPASQRSDEVSFLSDFVPSGIDTAHEETGEVDPVSEADVYMTYGRYEQAEELVREAMGRYPDRQDLKQKLLQIAYATKDVVTFSAVAEELQNVGFGQANPEAWQEIVNMGQELAPQNALFGGLASSAQGGGEAPATLAWSGGEDTIADVGGSDIVRAAAELQTPTEAPDDLGGLDFDLGLDVNADSPEAAEAALKELEASASEDLNLDLSDLEDLEASLGDSASVGVEAGGEGLSLEDLERSVRQDVGEDDSLTLGALDEAGSLDSLNLEGSDLGEEFSLETGESLGGVEQETAFTDDEIPGMADAGELAGGEPASAGLSDEVTTKLDLARAYVDMGDAEGARSILDEVLVEGDASQKEEANKLREQLI
jgi:pilus assembly protein FimV